MRVLVISESFAPGFRGGSIRALTHMVERLGDRCEFWVLTRDRDRHTSRFPGIEVDRWVGHGGARVFYRSTPHRAAGIRQAVTDSSPDVLFLNSVFARGTRITLALRRLGLLRTPVVIAAEGELSPGALAQKPGRKHAFLRVATTLRFFDDVYWIARDPLEAVHIRTMFGASIRLALVPYLNPLDEDAPRSRICKDAGSVRLLYLSRITPKKNLHFLLAALRDMSGAVDLDVVGPVDDQEYWASCLRLIDTLPPEVRARYHGECVPEKVAEWMSAAHVMVLPTLGENYGFVILEALAAARPALISDLTPWRDLEEAAAGWVVPLNQERWRSALQRIVAMTDEEYQMWSEGARRRALAVPASAGVEQDTLKVFADAASIQEYR